jgi:hypothetical protein
MMESERTREANHASIFMAKRYCFCERRMKNRAQDRRKTTAGKSMLNRLELTPVEATDDLLHGNQENRFFHGCYKNYCSLPLYIFGRRNRNYFYLRTGPAPAR